MTSSIMSLLRNFIFGVGGTKVSWEELLCVSSRKLMWAQVETEAEGMM